MRCSFRRGTRLSPQVTARSGNVGRAAATVRSRHRHGQTGPDDLAGERATSYPGQRRRERKGQDARQQNDHRQHIGDALHHHRGQATRAAHGRAAADQIGAGYITQAEREDIVQQVADVDDREGAQRPHLTIQEQAPTEGAQRVTHDKEHAGRQEPVAIRLAQVLPKAGRVQPPDDQEQE